VTFRARLLLAFLFVVIVPLTVVGLAVRRRVSDALTAQYEERVSALVAVIGRDIQRQDQMVADRLVAITEAMRADNRFRQGVLQRGASRAYVLDYAADAMRQSGLAMLQIQNAEGRILSSGHFRNEYDLMEAALPELLGQVPGGLGLAKARTPTAEFLALARADTVSIGTQVLSLVGGVAVDRTFLESLGATADVAVTLLLPGDSVPTPLASRDSVLVRELTVPYVATEVGGGGEVGVAQIVVAHSLAPLLTLRRSLDHWFVLAIGIAALVAVLIATRLATRISRPLSDLAEATARVDLERLDVTFASDRKDEIGALARTLDVTTERLRASVRSLKEVERRAALGDIARQVNHDIKNGLVPIRNVFRHLSQVAAESPATLPEVYRERQRTVESAVEYLEALAARYAALYPTLEPTTCDVNAIVERVVRGVACPPDADVQLDLADASLTVRADELALRRILENLVTNAVDSLPAEGGTVRVTTRSVSGEAGVPLIRLTVADTGVGMTADELDEAFGNFYTTKPSGTGLGLPIVRRLVNDIGGTLRVETEPGRGTTFSIDLPAAGGAA
jgi:signal transduction histidine kinase